MENIIVNTENFIKPSSILDHWNFLIFQNVMPESFNRDLGDFLLSQFKTNFSFFEESTPKNYITKKGLNIFHMHSPIFNTLSVVISSCVMRFVKIYDSQYRGKAPNLLNGWGSICWDFDGNVEAHRHHFSPFDLTGIYYATGDFTKHNGGTKFLVRQDDQNKIEEIYPTMGSLTLFQGTLLHAMSAYTSSKPRIVFPFDIRFSSKDIGTYSNLHTKQIIV